MRAGRARALRRAPALIVGREVASPYDGPSLGRCVVSCTEAVATVVDGKLAAVTSCHVQHM